MNEYEKEELMQRIRQQEDKISELTTSLKFQKTDFENKERENEKTLNRLQRSFLIACVYGSVFFTLLCMSNITHLWERIIVFVICGVIDFFLFTFATLVIPLLIKEWFVEQLPTRSKFSVWLSKHVLKITIIMTVIIIFVSWNYKVYY